MVAGLQNADATDKLYMLLQLLVIEILAGTYVCLCVCVTIVYIAYHVYCIWWSDNQLAILHSYILAWETGYTEVFVGR